MSKYNIDDMVYTSLFDYEYTKSELKSPNFIRAFLNKIGKNKQMIAELNAICNIKFSDNTIVFEPKVRRHILREQSYSKMIYVRNYVKNILIGLGFAPHVYHDKKVCKAVYLSLREPKNKQRLQQLGNVFKFDYATPVLTQSILDSIKQNKR